MKPLRSPLGPRIHAYIELKRAMGRRFHAAERQLHLFDDYIAGLDEPPEIVTRELVHGWLSLKPDAAPETIQSRGSIIRQFCIYLSRHEPQTYVPERALFPIRRSIFKARVYTQQEIRALLAKAQEKSQDRRRMDPRTIYTILLILCGTGLRASEVCGLSVSDVDLNSRTLLVRDTKFFKSRLVPFSSGVADSLHTFRTIRLNKIPNDPQAPFFLNHVGRPFGRSKLWLKFQSICIAAGIALGPNGRGYRLHDLRHSFAVNRLLQWYRQGVDITAKLPLLATYLGHGNVLSTHVYLTATAELLNEANERFERAYGSLMNSSQEEVPYECQ